MAIGGETLVAVVVALAGVDHHTSFGVAVLVAWACVARRLAGRFKSARQADRGFNAAPLYLIVLPIVAAALKFTLVESAVEASRLRAIDESAALVSDIERYRDVQGHYPRSLQSLWDDYRPSVVCIQRFRYEARWRLLQRVLRALRDCVGSEGNRDVQQAGRAGFFQS